jgi:hypothetical protein
LARQAADTTPSGDIAIDVDPVWLNLAQDMYQEPFENALPHAADREEWIWTATDPDTLGLECPQLYTRAVQPVSRGCIGALNGQRDAVTSFKTVAVGAVVNTPAAPHAALASLDIALFKAAAVALPGGHTKVVDRVRRHMLAEQRRWTHPVWLYKAIPAGLYMQRARLMLLSSDGETAVIQVDLVDQVLNLQRTAAQLLAEGWYINVVDFKRGNSVEDQTIVQRERTTYHNAQRMFDSNRISCLID